MHRRITLYEGIRRTQPPTLLSSSNLRVLLKDKIQNMVYCGVNLYIYQGLPNSPEHDIKSWDQAGILNSQSYFRRCCFDKNSKRDSIWTNMRWSFMFPTLKFGETNTGLDHIGCPQISHFQVLESGDSPNENGLWKKAWNQSMNFKGNVTLTVSYLRSFCVYLLSFPP